MRLLHAIAALTLASGCAPAPATPARGASTPKSNTAVSPETLVARLVRAGELEVSGENQAEADSYFDTARFRFHGPDGFEANYEGLTRYFEAVRAAFDERSICRGIIVAQGNYVACQTFIEGTFAREFTQSPAGALPPNGKRVTWDLLNIFRFDDQGRLVEEWVRTDHRTLSSSARSGRQVAAAIDASRR